jgi:hypothetical protein
MFLGSTDDTLFLRPDLPASGRRAPGRSRMAKGHREAAQSVLDRTKRAGIMNRRDHTKTQRS